MLVRAQAIAAAEQSRPSTHSFNNLGLGEELLAFLAEHNLHTPTEIQVSHMSKYIVSSLSFFAWSMTSEDLLVSLQSSAIEEILLGGDVLLASHTGSGKTLAYLLPVVRRCPSSHSHLRTRMPHLHILP